MYYVYIFFILYYIFLYYIIFWYFIKINIFFLIYIILKYSCLYIIFIFMFISYCIFFIFYIILNLYLYRIIVSYFKLQTYWRINIVEKKKHKEACSSNLKTEHFPLQKKIFQRVRVKINHTDIMKRKTLDNKVLFKGQIMPLQ